MKEKMKNPQIGGLILVYVAGFFNFVSFEQGDYQGGGNFFAVAKDPQIWSAKLLLLLPMVMIVCMIWEKVRIPQKVVTLIGSTLGVILTLFVRLSGGKRVASYNADTFSGEFKMNSGIGFWLMVVVWLALISWTLIKDFAITKETLEAKGVQGVLSSVKLQTLEAIELEDDGLTEESNLHENDSKTGGLATKTVSKIVDSASKLLSEDKRVCPSCGRNMIRGNKFCTFCGERVGTSSERTKTVFEFVREKSAIICESCENIIDGNYRYCPDCGQPVVVRIQPSVCRSCGKSVTSDFTFCPGCGAVIVQEVIQTNCKECGAELLYGKRYCVNCGAKL